MSYDSNIKKQSAKCTNIRNKPQNGKTLHDQTQLNTAALGIDVYTLILVGWVTSN